MSTTRYVDGTVRVEGEYKVNEASAYLLRQIRIQKRYKVFIPILIVVITMSKYPYVLEVQYRIPDSTVSLDDIKDIHHGKYLHIGYMRKIFKTKGDIIEYYDKHNMKLGMRSINAHGSMVSDWNPDTRLRYLVRAYHGECLQIAPFRE